MAQTETRSWHANDALARGRTARRLFEAGAAALGLTAGVAFAEPVLAAAARVWHGYVIPAYDELIKNGLLAWCM